jgi:hypothetical protein
MENKIEVCVGCENVQEALMLSVLSDSIADVRQIICKRCKELIDEGEFTPNEVKQMTEIINR